MNQFGVVFALLAVASVAMSASVFPRVKFTEWEGRIVGGSIANPGQFPHQVSLRSSFNVHFCGGCISNKRWAISASHCTVGRTPANTRVVVGAQTRTDGTTYTVSAIQNHPDFDANTMENDISAIQTTEEIIFTSLVQPIALGSSNIGGGISVYVSGWGQTSHPGSASNNLMFLNTRTLNSAVCRSKLSAANSALVFSSTICTFTEEGEGTCMGDSGGPLVVGGSVIGVVSWGVACARGFPDMYARVSSFRPWLLSIMN